MFFCSTTSTLAVALLLGTFAHAADHLGISPVMVGVTCDGIDFATLSESQAVAVGEILRNTYNQGQGMVDEGDSKLSDLVFRKAPAFPEGTVGFAADKAKSPDAVWTGDFSCTQCSNDGFERELVKTSRKNQEVTAWEIAFVDALYSDSSGAFSGANNCNVAMQAGALQENESPNVDIRVTCKSRKRDHSFTHLDISEGTFLSHAIQAAYNKVHADMDDDDSELEDVTFHGDSKRSLLDDYDDESDAPALGGYTWNPWWHPYYTPPHLTGYWGCRLCPNLDDWVIGGSYGMFGSRGALSAWESQLVVELNESNFALFQRMKTCSIDLRATSTLGNTEGEEVDCSLRGGCNEAAAAAEE